MPQYNEIIVDAKTGATTIRPYTPEEIAAVEGRAAPAVLTLEEAKKAKLALLADLRWQNVTRVGVRYDGKQYSSDDRSQQAYIAAAFLAGQVKGQTFAWKLKNGEHITLTADKIIGLATAIGRHVQLCFNTEAEVAAKIVAATTQAELDAVNMVFGPVSG